MYGCVNVCAYLCMYVCMYVSTLNTCTCAHQCCVYACMLYDCMHLCRLYVHYVYVCANGYVCIYLCIHMYACAYVRVCVCAWHARVWGPEGFPLDWCTFTTDSFGLITRKEPYRLKVIDVWFLWHYCMGGVDESFVLDTIQINIEEQAGKPGEMYVLLQEVTW